MTCVRNLLACAALHSGIISRAQSVDGKVAEISGYESTFALNDTASGDLTLGMSAGRVAALRKAVEGAVLSDYGTAAKFNKFEYNTSLQRFTFTCEDAQTMLSTQSILDNADLLNDILAGDAELSAWNGSYFGDYTMHAKLLNQVQVVFAVSGVTGALPDELTEKIAQDVTLKTNSAPSDVKVLTAANSFIAYVRTRAGTASYFEAMEQSNGTSLNTEWLELTAASMGVKTSSLKITSVNVLSYAPARGYFDVSYGASPIASDIAEKLNDDKNLALNLAESMVTDMSAAIGLPYVEADEYTFPRFEIIRKMEDGFTVAYDVTDPIMWTVGRLVKERSTFPLETSAQLLEDYMNGQRVTLEVTAMEQQDRSTEPYGTITALFVGATSVANNGTAASALEYALRNDIIEAAGLAKEDLFGVYIVDSSSADSFDVAIEPNSEKAYEDLKAMLTEKQDDSSWLTEARAEQPELTYTRFEDDTAGLGGNGGVRTVDTTCRVGGLHCDHIKGIVVLLLLTIIISAVGYYFVIHRPSKKRQANEVQEIQPNHTFVFTRSLGASTHRSAAGSFYGGSRHGTRGGVPRPGSHYGAEEVDISQVQVEEAALYHGNQQHPAAYH